MNSEKQNSTINDEIGLLIVNKAYPYKKFAITYFHQVYGKGSRFSSAKRTAVYYALNAFGKYLEKEKITIPCKEDLLKFLVKNNWCLDNLKLGVPAICDFIDYCQENQKTLFNGTFKDWTIKRIIKFSKSSIFKRDETIAFQTKIGDFTVYEDNSDTFKTEDE